ncbi:MAG: hypothetical protein NTV52_18630 [Acidobacteria bacterium]|nr:hypothetical protein [Acidobacteriota bacterium]
MLKSWRPSLNPEHTFRALPTASTGLTAEEEIERFLRLRIQRQKIEDEIDLLTPRIVTLCEEAATGVRHRLGTIRIQRRRGWEYPTNLKRLAELLKDMRKAAEEDGTATVKKLTLYPAVTLHGFGKSQARRGGENHCSA